MNTRKLQSIITGLLAVLLLVSTLAACGEFGHRGNDTNEQETIEIPEGPLDPDECGLQVFEYFDFTHCFEGGSYGEKLKKDFDYFMSEEFELTDDISAMQYSAFSTCLALKNLVGKGNERKNVEIDISDLMGSYWTHKIISTQTDLAMISKAPNGKLYVTGLVDGELKNDAGFIDERSVPNLQRLSEPAIYNAMLDCARKEFFGQLWDLKKSRKITMNTVLTTAIGDKILSKDELICQISSIHFMKDGFGIIAKAYVTEDISEDYIDQLLANETIVAVPDDLPVRTWPEEETKKEPEETRYKPTAPSGPPVWIEPETPEPQPDWEEGETTAEETETETEAEVDPSAA